LTGFDFLEGGPALFCRLGGSLEDDMKKEEAEAVLGRGDLGPIEDYLEELATEDRLPAFALGMCLLRLEEAAPALRAVLAKAAASEPLSSDEGRLLFRGVYILGGGRDTASCQPLLRLLRRDGEELEELFGNARSEGFPRIIAGVFDGDIEALFDLISDPTVDESVGEASLGAAAFLTWNGSIPRERMRQLLQQLFEGRLVEEAYSRWSTWLISVALLGFRDMAPLAERLWKEDRVDNWLISQDEFHDVLSQAEQRPDDAARFEEYDLGHIEDVLVALEGVDYERSEEFAKKRDDFSESRVSPWAPMEPVRIPWRHVGRNDPCPCGSGKKAKKCCLASGI